ncbi:unnamed protein product, partial [Tetraodon nigroviridis]
SLQQYRNQTGSPATQSPTSPVSNQGFSPGSSPQHIPVVGSIFGDSFYDQQLALRQTNALSHQVCEHSSGEEMAPGTCSAATAIFSLFRLICSAGAVQHDREPHQLQQPLQPVLHPQLHPGGHDGPHWEQPPGLSAAWLRQPRQHPQHHTDSHRGVPAEPLQRADQLVGGRRRRQLRRRHAVPSRRAEDRPADPGRAAHAQRSGHGAGRPCHRGHVQDGQAVTDHRHRRRSQKRRGKKKNTLTGGERSTGQDKPDPLLHGFPAI